MTDQQDDPIGPDSEGVPRPKRRSSVTILVMGVAIGFIIGVILMGLLDFRRDLSRELFDETTVTSIYEAVSPAVVEIEVTRPLRSLPIDIPSWGSGFLVDDEGHIVTNYHVVAQGSEYLVRLSDGREVEAVRLGFSQADDLAVVKVAAEEVEGITPLTLSDSSEVSPGQMAVAVGSPFREFNSVGVGVVSGTGRRQTSVLNRPIPDMIQTDVPLNPGNSGGPLLNSDGEVIGINSSVRIEQGDRGGWDYRIGFAIPSNTAKDILPRLVASEDLRRPWIGISGTPVTHDMIQERGLPRGIFVTAVFANSPARRAGLNPFRNLTTDVQGDIITAIDGRAVESVDEMVSYLNTKQPGDRVTLQVVRDGAERRVELTLDPWPSGA